MSLGYRIGTVARLTGISTDTLRAWERRYGAVVPGRGGRGRDYGQAEVERLILLRRVVERGHAIGTVAKLSDEELRGMLVETGAATGTAYPLIQPVLAALENFDSAAITEQFGRIAAVLPPAETVQQLVLPVMKEAGERWHAGSFSMAQMCLLSGLSQNLLGTLMNLYRPAPGAPRVVFSVPQGESHTVGVLAAAMLAAGSGLAPIYLGTGLPAKEVALAVRRSGAKVVIMQIGGVPEVPADRQVHELLAALPSGVELWLGGLVNFPHEGAKFIEDFAALGREYQRLMAA